MRSSTTSSTTSSTNSSFRRSFSSPFGRSAATASALAAAVALVAGLGSAACRSSGSSTVTKPGEPPAPTPTEPPTSASPDRGDPADGGARGEPAPPGPAAPPAGGGLSGDAATILAAHNRVRATHCARPLAWSEALAATAQEWASSLRDSGCRFEHSQTAYGENLAAGTRLSAANAVELWYAEEALYNYKKPGFSMKTGHFTQVVWAGSRSLGCGFSECQGMRLWVCHYDPPGNVMSLFPDNVSPPTCK